MCGNFTHHGPSTLEATGHYVIWALADGLPRRISLNIILLNDYGYAEGGASRVALIQAEALAARGHKVQFFVAQASASDPRAVDSTQTRTIPMHATGQWDLTHDPRPSAAAFRGLWNMRSSAEFADQLARFSPEDTVVIVHSWNKALSSSVIRRAYQSGFAVVCVAHDFSVACPNGALYNYQTRSPCDLRPMAAACLRTHCDKQSYPHKLWRVARQVIQEQWGGVPNNIDALIFVSESAHSIIKPWLPKNLAQYVLANPLPLPPAGTRQPDVAVNQAFVFAGRLSPEKGALLLAEATQSLGHPVTFIGDGEQRNLIRETLPCARITGWLSSDQVWQELAQARALVFPSVCRETFGLVVYEAAALGIPAIVPKNSVVTEFVRHGHNGLTFAAGDSSALNEQLQLLADRPQWAAKLGEQAQQDLRVLDLSPARHVERLEHILVDARHAASNKRSVR